MPDLSTQLRDYFDATASPIEVEEIINDDLWVPARQTHPKRRTTSKWAYGLAAAVAVLVVVFGVALLLPGGNGNEVADTTPSTGFESAFEGMWVKTDADGSTPTMTVQVSEDGVVEIVVVDDNASVCSGAPSTMTGTGRLDSETVVVIPEPILTCDDGTVPAALSGPPLAEQLLNLTFTLDLAEDIISDNLGGVWAREGAEPPVTGWWPQSNLEEMQAAQELADAGDPGYTWQVDPTLTGDAPPWEAEIFARFIEEELGWEAWEAGTFGGYMTGDQRGHYEQVLFIRCAPGQTNPLSSLYAEVPPEIRRCAPTIDDLGYETVGISVSQPVLRGPSGLWVVTRVETFQSKPPEHLWDLLSPDFLVGRQVEQVIPPTDAEVTALLEAFSEARVDGAGAEQYLFLEPEGSPFQDDDVPVLYATSSGAPYERSEIEKVEGPTWPTGSMLYRVELIAEDGTVVEQYFHVVRRENGQLGLAYGLARLEYPTTENGQPVALHYSIVDSEVTFAAAPPWEVWWDEIPTAMTLWLSDQRNANVVIATDPLTTGVGCDIGPPAIDAEALSRSVMADPEFEAIGTAPVQIAGLDGLQVDLRTTAAAEDGVCFWQWVLDVNPGYAGWRMRLYLVDYPGDAAQVLTVSIIAPENYFERVLEEATPIVESLQIDAP